MKTATPDALESLKASLGEAEKAVAEFEKEVALRKDDVDLERDRAAKDVLRNAIRNRGDVQQVLKQVEARRIFWRILERGGPYRSTFDKDPHVSAFLEGRRSLALEVLEMILDADPAVYLQMQREHVSDFKSQNPKKEGDE